MLPTLFVSGFLRKPQILIYTVQAIRKKPALRHTLWRPPCAKLTLLALKPTQGFLLHTHAGIKIPMALSMKHTRYTDERASAGAGTQHSCPLQHECNSACQNCLQTEERPTCTASAVVATAHDWAQGTYTA